MNTFLNGLKEETNVTYTENGALVNKSTLNKVIDLFAFGAAYRSRTEQDCINLFEDAYLADPLTALKCLFYIGDCRGGQGERRFFRVCFRWLCMNYPEVARFNAPLIPYYRRWDDLIYSTINTPVEKDALEFIEYILKKDMQEPDDTKLTLLGKWLPSENATSLKTKATADKIRKFLHMTHKEYRKTLSELRKRIKVLERYMSANEWDKIEFDKIPSVAGFRYKEAFIRHDCDRKKKNTVTYEEFAKDATTTVNAATLYPYECVREAFSICSVDVTKRLMVNKYWDNLTDYIRNAKFNGIAVVDTSGSMMGTPLNVAVSLGLYCAEKNSGPYANHFITFSSKPELVEIKGKDFYEKATYIRRNGNWQMNTNLKATFDLLLKVAKAKNCKQEQIPENLIIISDMEFDECVSQGDNLLMEIVAKEWAGAGYRMPHIIFWNVNARHNLIPYTKGRVSFVSGFSPSIFEQIMSGKESIELVYDVINQDRYLPITLPN